ncbi:TadE/TadG family type IV pilus assembly protein [Bradyrhizobium erythrophlei]|uniref:TadE/TadG family type IV pilus assembly protein n=1 Tax=Bradyrhizobium erythrophlei TaxID=1437360 RepID=UPI0035E85051
MAMRISGIWRNEDGSALLEGTVLMPFLMTLILGTLDYSFFFYQQHLVAGGVRDAARYLARTSNPSSSTSQTTAQNLATTGSPTGGSYRRVNGFDPGNVAISISYVGNALNATTHLRAYREAPPECGGPDQIAIINVTGSFPYASFGFLTYLGLSSPTVSVTHSERCIGLS